MKKLPFCKKKTTTEPNALRKKKQTNLLFEDESHAKIIYKRQDFYSANVLRNSKTTFNSVEAIVSK